MALRLPIFLMFPLKFLTDLAVVFFLAGEAATRTNRISVTIARILTPDNPRVC